MAEGASPSGLHASSLFSPLLLFLGARKIVPVFCQCCLFYLQFQSLMRHLMPSLLDLRVFSVLWSIEMGLGCPAVAVA